METVEVLNKKTIKHMECMKEKGNSCIKCMLYEACHGEGNYADRLNKAAEGLE